MGPCTKNSRCCVCGKKKSTHPGVKLHLFPKDARRRMQWLRILNIAFEKKSQAICGDHFDPKWHAGKGRLLCNAVPHPPDGCDEQQPQTYLECPDDPSEGTNVPDIRKTSPISEVLPPSYKCDDANFGVISYSRMDHQDAPESPMRTSSLEEGASLRVDLGEDWEDTNISVISSSDPDHQEVQPSESTAQTSSVEDDTVLHVDLDEACDLAWRRREEPDEWRKTIIVTLHKSKDYANEDINVPDIALIPDVLPLNFKCDDTNFGVISYSRMDHQDTPKSPMRTSSLAEGALLPIDLGGDWEDTNVGVISPSDPNHQELHASESPFQTSNVEGNILLHLDLDEESCTSEEELQVTEASESCRKCPTPEHPHPLPPIIGCSSKSTTLPDITTNVIQPSVQELEQILPQLTEPFLGRRQHCLGCQAPQGTCVGIQVETKRRPITSEWSTQTNLMMVECGTQTSITGVDLKPYENKHLKFVEALHRKCITDYIMKDDSTCMFFTGLTVTCLMYLYDYLKDKAFNLNYWKGLATTQQFQCSHARKLSTLEEFLLCLVHLRRGMEHPLLACMFRVMTGHISRLIITWISFLHKELRPLSRTPAEEEEEDQSGSSRRIPKKKIVQEYRLLQQPVQLNTKEIRVKALQVCEAMWKLQQ